MLVVVTTTYEGKRGLVLGVANKRSIAWAIARRLADAGAELAFTYQGERIEKSVRDLAESLSSPLVTECDVRSDVDVARVFREVGEAFDGGLDLLVHAVAFAAADVMVDGSTGDNRVTALHLGKHIFREEEKRVDVCIECFDPLFPVVC